MKTPIQELIETFEEMLSPIDSKVDVDFAISLVKSMLEKEKETIVEAFREGVKYWNGDEYKLIDVEQYYIHTFNTKEK